MRRTTFISQLQRAVFLLLAVLALAQGVSCRREPLVDSVEINGFQLVIRPRWIEMDTRPTGMTAIIYPTDGSTPTRISTNTVDSISVPIAAGNYRVLLFNQAEGDFKSLSFRHMESFYDCEVIVNEDTDHKMSYEIFPTSQMSNEPDVLAVDYCNELSVTQAEVDEARKRGKKIVKTLTMKPHIVISTLYIRVPVVGIYNGLSAQGCIDGMSRHIYMTYYDTGDKLASQVIPGWTFNYESISSNNGTITASCKTMGLPGTSLYLTSGASIETSERQLFKSSVRSQTDPKFKPEDIRLHLKVILVDRKSVVDTLFLVGDQIERTINEPLILNLNCKDTLRLPYAKPEGSGAAAFDADFDDWIEHEDIINL